MQLINISQQSVVIWHKLQWKATSRNRSCGVYWVCLPQCVCVCVCVQGRVCQPYCSIWIPMCTLPSNNKIRVLCTLTTSWIRVWPGSTLLEFVFLSFIVLTTSRAGVNVLWVKWKPEMSSGYSPWTNSIMRDMTNISSHSNNRTVVSSNACTCAGLATCTVRVLIQFIRQWIVHLI